MQTITYVVAAVTAVVAQSLSHVELFVTPWTTAHQAPLSSVTYRINKALLYSTGYTLNILQYTITEKNDQLYFNTCKMSPRVCSLHLHLFALLILCAGPPEMRF